MLSGCGVYDGSEIHEAVLTLLALDRAGAEITCMAPNIDQYHVVNHMTQEVMKEKRNVLLESARIARGEIKDLKDVNATDLDGLIIPGGFGIVTTPAYMLGPGIKEVAEGIQKLVDKVLELASK